MEHLAEYDIPYILSKIRFCDRRAVKRVTLFGFKVGVSSLKLQTFKKNIRCVGCGLVANKFILERDGDRNPHLNMYFEDEDDKRKILFTKDHIIPLSKKGPDHLCNMQTMCESCNVRKEDKIQQKYFNGYSYSIIKKKKIKLEGVMLEKRETDSKRDNSCKCLGHGTRRNVYIW